VPFIFVGVWVRESVDDGSRAMPGRAGGGTRPYVVLFSPCVFFVRSGLEIRYLTTETLRHGENRAFLFLSPNAVWDEKRLRSVLISVAGLCPAGRVGAPAPTWLT